MKAVTYIVGTGRCGTVWISRLLNTSKKAGVFHELFARTDRISTRPFIPCQSRTYIVERKDIVDRLVKQNGAFVEANPYMLYHIDALWEILDAKIYLQIRDGRDVVRSWYSRGTLKPGDSDLKHFPFEGSTRFEKLCWWWNYSNRLAIEKNVEIIIFEKLISDWNYFDSIFHWFEIDEAVWDAQRLLPRNTCNHFTLRHYSEWTGDLLETFDKHCGELMRELGCYG